MDRDCDAPWTFHLTFFYIKSFISTQYDKQHQNQRLLEIELLTLLKAQRMDVLK